jgi:hypothetical protein
MTTDERAVLDALTGRRRPITQADLAFGRAVQEAIESLRLAGHPILSSGDGMRLSADPDEVAACAEALHKRAVTQMETASKLARTAARMRAPTTLWEGRASS